MDDSRRNILKTVFITYAVVSAIVAVGVRLKYNVPLVGNVGAALIAISLLYLPVVVSWRFRRDEDLITYGFVFEPVRRGLAFAGGYVLVVLPIFVIVFVSFFQLACDTGLSRLVPDQMCRQFLGWTNAKGPTINLEFWEWALGQLVVVALTEELFFRGFLHHLLEKAIPPTRRVMGGGIGLALLISSALFALLHIHKTGDPRSLATFFPGLLFGWMRSATGSILASTIAHASSNVLMRLLNQIFLR